MHIFVKTSTGKTITLDVQAGDTIDVAQLDDQASDTIDNVKAETEEDDASDTYADDYKALPWVQADEEQALMHKAFDAWEAHLKEEKKEAEGSMQIFVKTLNFGTITLDVKASDTVDKTAKRCRMKIYDLFTGNDIDHMLCTEQRMIFAGKELEDSRTISDFNIQKESTLRMVGGIPGGMPVQKKARSKKEDEISRDELMEATMKDINRLKNEVGNLSNDAVLLAVANNINTTLASATGDHDTLKNKVALMAKTDLMKLMSGLDTSNGLLKADNVRKVLFKDGLEAIRAKQDQCKGLQEAMTALTKFLLIAAYTSDEDPSISWSRLKSQCMKAKEALDKEAGRAEARAEAARAKAAPAAPADPAAPAADVADVAMG